MIYPDADIPVVQMSLDRSLNPALHYQVGQTLAPLRQEGILILCSGQATHNMGYTRADSTAPNWAKDFASWMATVASTPSMHTVETAMGWPNAPGAKMAHPREEHLVPFFVALGASAGQTGQKILDGWMAGHFSLQSFMWADPSVGAKKE